MKKKIIGVVAAIVLVVVGYVFLDAKDVETTSDPEQNDIEASPQLDDGESVDPNEPQQEKPVLTDDPEAEVDIYYLGEAVSYESLTEPQQIAVDFMRDFMNTVGYQTEEQHFEGNIRPYLEEGFETFSDLMGSEYLVPFELDRTINSIDIIGEQERETVSIRIREPEREAYFYDILMEVTYNGNQTFGIPLTIDPDYDVMGYNDTYRDLIENMMNYQP